VLLGFLAAAVALVTIYVLTNNSIASRTAKLNNLKTEVAQEQAAVSRLGEFTKFAQLAQTRISTVHAIAAARFDWHAALSDLSKVVPANVTLGSVVGTVVPGATTGGSGSGGTGNLRSSIAAPAFELTGCTRSQDDVAKFMSQLRLINGVTRVTISDSQISSSASAPSAGGSSQGCGANTPSFDLVVFFSPVANAGAAGVTSVAGTTIPTSTGGTP
jgi:Tfp pilus assembly protein PilN